MYLQPALEITDQTALATFAYRHPFATVITSFQDSITVSHIPLVCDVDPLRIRGHVARVNPQAEHLQRGCRIRFVFHGPHRYLSPGGSPTAPLLPTWNYAAVHGSGSARVLDECATRALLHDMVTRFEGRRDRPWQLESAAALVEQLFPLILAFQIDDLVLESRFKITRDRNIPDAQTAIAELTGTNDPIEREILALLKFTSRAG
jgi:transcriptional regulator